MSGSYPVPNDACEAGIEIKKSRFIAHAIPVQSREQAMLRVAEVRQRYQDARHFCWAYVIGDPAGSCDAAMNDDGEPSGTAGKPILNVLRHKGVGDVLLVVVRYFGGIKLGAGGLTRAYASSAEAVMSTLIVREREPLLDVTLHCNFSDEQAVRHWVENHGLQPGNAEYADRVTIRLQLPVRLSQELDGFCLQHGIDCAWPPEGKTAVLPSQK